MPLHAPDPLSWPPVASIWLFSAEREALTHDARLLGELVARLRTFTANTTLAPGEADELSRIAGLLDILHGRELVRLGGGGQ